MQITYQKKDLLYYEKYKENDYCGLACCIYRIATMIIKIPTPTFGYIHLGDGLVLLCGIILGPGIGALAAGIGTMFADIFSGYMTGSLPL